MLEQRLPRESTGLCDVAISIVVPEGLEGGVLNVTLWTAEDEREHAQWQLPANELRSGWLRLSLLASLEDDARTPFLRLAWDGEVGLELDWSVKHPDPRFQAIIDGKETGATLALRSWSFVAGVEAPLPEDGVLPGRIVRRKRVVSNETLAAAQNLTPECETFGLLEEHRALLVHITPSGHSVARLPAAVKAGVRHVSAEIQTRSEKAPNIEYAIAIAPASRRPDPSDPVPHFRRDDVTSWVELRALEPGALHLYLPDPVEETSDLYLMVRPAAGVADVSWGWSTFSAITLED